MAELIQKILIAMGLSEGDIPNEIIEYFLNEWTEVYPDNECLVLHNTVCSLYEWLIKGSAQNASGGGKVREKEGLAEIELDDYNKAKDWESAYKDYLEAPWLAFPSCVAVLGAGVKGRVKVGGVRKDQICSIKNNKNIRTNGASEVTGVKQPNAYRYRRTGRRNSFVLDDDDC